MLLTQVIICISFLAYVVIGWFVSKKIKTTTQYLTMGRSAGTFYTTGTIVASYLASMAFISTFSTGYKNGMSSAIVQYGCIVTFMILAFVLGPRLYRAKVKTIPEFFKKRYGTERMGTVSAILLIIACTAFNISTMAASGVALGTPLGISSSAAIIISGIIVVVFSAMGGMWGVVVTDSMMFIIFFLAVGIGWPIAVTHAGSEPIASVVATINNVLPGAFKVTGYMPTWGSKYLLGQDGFVGWLVPVFLVSGTLGLGSAQTVSRVFIPKNEKTVAKSFILAQVLLCFFLMLLMSTAPFIKVVAPADLQPTQGYLWMIQEYFPTILKGFALAGIAAAGLSTSSTLLQQAGASITQDLYMKFAVKDKKKLDDKQILKISKWFMAGIGVIVILCSLYTPVADLMIFYSFIFAAGLFTCWIPAMLGGALSERVTEKAAFWSILISMIVYLVWWFIKNFVWHELPHQIYPAIILSTMVLIVMSRQSQPTLENRQAFWQMQTKKYKKAHNYTEIGAAE